MTLVSNLPRKHRSWTALSKTLCNQLKFYMFSISSEMELNNKFGAHSCRKLNVIGILLHRKNKTTYKLTFAT